MIEFLKDYVCEWEDQLNIPLMTKEADRSLVEYIKDCWLSLEVVKNIKVVKFEYSERESEIDINKHIFRREKHKKKKDKHGIKNVNDSRVGKLIVYLNITMEDRDRETGEVKKQVYPIKKTMLLPLQDENGYFYIKGKKFILIYQLLEKSTYTSNSSITLKSLMPINVKRYIIDAEDSNGIKYHLPYYKVPVFRKDVTVILFYLSKGIKYALDYLNVSHVISFIDTLPEEDDTENIYFPLSSKCYLVVDREMFAKYQYIQSIVGAFKAVTTSRVTIQQLNDSKQWIKKIVVPNNYEKGLSTLNYFGRLLDETTRKVLLLPDYYRDDIYAVLRWQMEHYNELRLKDNCDLSNKRLRCNEYIASLLSKEFSKRLNRYISMGNKANIESMREIFKFSGDRVMSPNPSNCGNELLFINY